MSPTAWKRAQLGCTLVAIGLIWPSVTVWRNSIPYLIALSVWALVASHAAGWMAARGEESAVDKADLDPIKDALRAVLADQAVILDRLPAVPEDQPDT